MVYPHSTKTRGVKFMAMQELTIQKSKKAQQLIDEGVGVTKACKTAGVHYTSFLTWKKGGEKNTQRSLKKNNKGPYKIKRKPLTYSTIPALPILNEPHDGFAVRGSPEQVARFLFSLSNQFKGVAE